MEEFERRMAALRDRFVERARTEAAALRDAHARDDRDALRQLAHGLAGSAGLFGFTELGGAAREFELALDHDDDGGRVQRLERLLALIAAA